MTYSWRATAMSTKITLTAYLSKTRMPGTGGGGDEEKGWVAEEEGKQHKGYTRV
jgi:hypothetical protein